MNKDFTTRLPFEMFLQCAERYPENPALIARSEELTYRDLLNSVKYRAQYFKEKGVKQGSKTAIYTDNELELTVSMYAIWALGAVFMPMHISQTRDKLELIENIVTPDIGFNTEDYKSDIKRSFPMELLENSDCAADKFEPCKPDDTAIIMFTSGTSGVPKAVPMTAKAIGHNAWETSSALKLTEKDRILINTPPYYTSTIIHNLTLQCRGGAVVVDRGFFFGDALLKTIEKNHCTGFGGVPVHFSRLAGSLDRGKKPETLRFLMNSGEHLPTPVLKEIRKALPEVEFYCVYGLTEVAGRLCILDPETTDSKSGSVGKPLPGMKISIRDENGNIVNMGEVGEVHVSGIGLMSGYLNNPDVNDKVFKPYGFATGDYGFLDEDGFLYLKGRNDDIMKVGGEKVSVKMIEEAVFGFEDFSDFLVGPVYDENMGNIPCLYYVLKPGLKFNRTKLIKHLRKILPANHIPVKFAELKEIPRADSGKAQRKNLSENKLLSVV